MSGRKGMAKLPKQLHTPAFRTQQCGVTGQDLTQIRKSKDNSTNGVRRQMLTLLVTIKVIVPSI